jgi:hypothetical protein
MTDGRLLYHPRDDVYLMMSHRLSAKQRKISGYHWVRDVMENDNSKTLRTDRGQYICLNLTEMRRSGFVEVERSCPVPWPRCAECAEPSFLDYLCQRCRLDVKYSAR